MVLQQIPLFRKARDVTSFSVYRYLMVIKRLPIVNYLARLFLLFQRFYPKAANAKRPKRWVLDGHKKGNSSRDGAARTEKQRWPSADSIWPPPWAVLWVSYLMVYGSTALVNLVGST